MLIDNGKERPTSRETHLAGEDGLGVPRFPILNVHVSNGAQLGVATPAIRILSPISTLIPMLIPISMPTPMPIPIPPGR